ncbi:MAG TPA: MAE_28990/MAE_18760 family HEPN-like nuclease [Chitinophagaceae bacterium]|nr:MAE_28990/MAE_18760 family HEPN-like nuclease [Chitinophagaceae bacterium]
MSKENRTISLLNQNIDEDYSWRIKELDDFKTVLEKAKDTSTQGSLIRAGITLLYAHWEGFIKESAYCYYNFVTIQGFQLNTLTDNFIAISLKKELNELIESKRIKLQTKAVSILFAEFSKRGHFPPELPLWTANLDFNTFEEYCILLGIDITPFETKRQFIDKKLVQNRHTIAHGKYLKVDIKSFMEIYSITLVLLKTFKERILNSALIAAYRRTA